MMNIVNGGKHAENSVDFQEFMVMPLGAPNFAEALRYGAETFHALAKLLKGKGYATSVGDEGGFAPNLGSNEEACELIVEGDRGGGLQARQGHRHRARSRRELVLRKAAPTTSRSRRAAARRSDEMIALYAAVDRHVPDRLDRGRPRRERLGRLCARRPRRRASASRSSATTSSSPTPIHRARDQGKGGQRGLIKLNQIGTVTETVEAIALCRKAGWNYVVSHRSGETEDAFLADFTVAMGGGQIKTGSASRSERIAKYNRLLEIEAELGKAAQFGSPFA